jgi:hypothetical protein
MSTPPNSPQLVKGGVVLLDPVTTVVVRFVALQYNPDSLTRTLQPQGAGGEGQDRSEALRLRVPPVESFRLEAEIDATDQLERGVPPATEVGIFPQLAALEMLVYPPSDRLQANHRLAAIGTLEIVPVESPLTLFVWSKSRIVPVRLTEFSITEEAFDPALNPIRAKISLGMRVLNVDDLGFDHKGGSLFLTYQQQKERLAGLGPAASLASLGITSVP